MKKLFQFFCTKKHDKFKEVFSKHVEVKVVSYNMGEEHEVVSAVFNRKVEKSDIDSLIAKIKLKIDVRIYQTTFYKIKI